MRPYIVYASGYVDSDINTHNNNNNNKGHKNCSEIKCLLNVNYILSVFIYVFRLHLKIHLIR